MDEETSTDSPPPFDELIDDAMFVLKLVSVGYGLAGLACLITGIFVLIYADPFIVWPYCTGSGIWTGVLCLANAALGLDLQKRFNQSFPRVTRCRVWGVKGCSIGCMVTSVIHLIFTGIGFYYCAHNTWQNGTRICNEEERGRLMLIEGFCLAFGLAVCLLSMFIVTYLLVGKRMYYLTGGHKGKLNTICTCR